MARRNPSPVLTPLPHQPNVGLVVLGAKIRLLPPIAPLGDVVRDRRTDNPRDPCHMASGFLPFSGSGIQYGARNSQAGIPAPGDLAMNLRSTEQASILEAGSVKVIPALLTAGTGGQVSGAVGHLGGGTAWQPEG